MPVRSALAALCLVTAAAVIAPSLTVAANQSQAEQVGAPEARQALRRARSRPLRDMPTLPPTAQRREHHVRPVTFPGGPATQDQATQQFMVAPLSAIPGLGFDGIGEHSVETPYNVNSVPSDINGAVGTTQYVQWVNTSFAVYNKANGQRLVGPTAGNTLWQDLGGRCAAANDGDPIAQFDKLANRWVMTQFQVTFQPYSQCIAVSETEDATGNWYLYEYAKDNFPDYPKMGVWPDAYYITYNMFTQTFQGPRACAYDRSAMLIGAAATEICVQLSNQHGALLPSDLDGLTPPPPGSPNYLMSLASTSLRLYEFDVDFTTPASSSLTWTTSLAVAGYTRACASFTRGACVPQLGASELLESLSDRIMYRLAYRNFGTHESMVVNHAVTASGRTGIRWYEVRNPGTSPVIHQQSTYSPDAHHRWMGSVAMDQAGNMALGYSVSSTTMHPGIRFAGRDAADPLNNLSLELNIIDGGGSQAQTRWGDYTSMSIDPIDDCTFWYTNQYLQVGGAFNWDTRIASFKFDSCGGPVEPDFMLSVQPGTRTVPPGSFTSMEVSSVAVGGFDEAIDLGTSPLPAGVVASFDPVSIMSGSGFSSIGLTVSGTTAPGTYDFDVIGTASSATRTAPVTLVVEAPAQGDFSFGATPGTVNIRRGDSAVYDLSVSPINGYSDNVTFSVAGLPLGTGWSASPASLPGSGSAVLTVTTSGSTPRDRYTLVISAIGEGGTPLHTAEVTLRVR